MTESTHDERLEDLPPSPSYVYDVLERKGPLTQPEIVEASYLGARTTRWAVTRLVDEGLVETRPAPDARQRRYHIAR